MTSTLFWAIGALTSFLGTIRLSDRSIHSAFVSTLDKGAQVYYPGSEEFGNATVRWSAAQTPQYDLVIKVATEGDVQKSVRNTTIYNTLDID